MNWNLRDSLSGSGKGADAGKGGDVGEFVGNSKQDFLRFHELTIRNAYQEQMTSLNMVFCEGESYLLCSLDHTGRSFTELFHGNSHVISGYIFGADGTAQNGTGDFFLPPENLLCGQSCAVYGFPESGGECFFAQIE